MTDIDKDVVWLIVGGLTVVGAIYLCAIDKLSSEVPATMFGVIVKGFVDALGRRDRDVVPPTS